MKFMKKLYIIFLLSASIALYGQDLHDKHSDLPCINQHFDVFVHLVKIHHPIPKEEIDLAVELANKYFSPICISFEICDIDTAFNYNYNALYNDALMREFATLYKGNNKINLYFVSGEIQGLRIQSWSFGKIGRDDSANIFIRIPQAFPYELGHFFGLKSTFRGNGEELVDGSNCKTAGDLICDTPADPYRLGKKTTDYVKGCVFYYNKTDLNGDYYQPDVGNVMSYYFACHCGFSYQQYKKMAENYYKSNIKYW